MKLHALVIRNIRLFFKDKGMVISSLITPLILILLYVTFLKNVYVDSFNAAIKTAGVTLEDTYINGFVYGWLFSSLVAVSGVTVSFCSNLLMVQDKVTGSIHDLRIATVSKAKISFAYYIASMTETMLIVLFEILVGFIIMGVSGWYLSVVDVLGILFGSFLLVNFGTALSSIIHYFLTTQGQMSAVGTLVSTVYGFICGAYMPISQFGSGLQKVLSFLPGTYATALIRNHYEEGILKALVNECHFPQEIVNTMAQNFDINLFFFDNKVSLLSCYLVLGGSIVLFLGVYIALNLRKKAK